MCVWYFFFLYMIIYTVLYRFRTVASTIILYHYRLLLLLFFLSLYSYCVDIVYPPSSIKTEEPKFQIDGDLCFIFLFSPFVSFQISSLRIRQQQCLLNWPNLTDKILYCICLGRYTVLYYNIKHRYSCWQVFFSLHHFNNIIV